MAISTINQAGLNAPLTLTSPVLTTPTISTGAGTASFPSATGTVMVSGNMPAFSAYASAVTTASTATFTKVAYATENFDTNSNFASSRFTPTVAGYYQINANQRFGSITSANNVLRLYKNGSSYVNGASCGVVAGFPYMSLSSVIYLNGSTDYVEVYIYQSSGTDQNTDADLTAQFSGCLLRTA
jgi:hypothetical protein